MIVKRNLSGIYFRSKNNGMWDNIVFEDLNPEEQDRVMENRNIQWLKSLIEKLFETYSNIVQYILSSNFPDISNDELNQISNALIVIKTDTDEILNECIKVDLNDKKLTANVENSLKRIAKTTADMLNKVSNRFDIYAGTPDNS